MPKYETRGMGPNADESGLPQTRLDGALPTRSKKIENSVLNDEQKFINQTLFLVLSPARGTNGLLCDQNKSNHFEIISNHFASAALCRLNFLSELFLSYRRNNTNDLLSIS